MTQLTDGTLSRNLSLLRQSKDNRSLSSDESGSRARSRKNTASSGTPSSGISIGESASAFNESHEDTRFVLNKPWWQKGLDQRHSGISEEISCDGSADDQYVPMSVIESWRPSKSRYEEDESREMKNKAKSRHYTTPYSSYLNKELLNRDDVTEVLLKEAREKISRARKNSIGDSSPSSEQESIDGSNIIDAHC